jgi:hypothetical protein
MLQMLATYAAYVWFWLVYCANNVNLLRLVWVCYTPFFTVLVFSNGTFFTVLIVHKKICCDDVGIVRKL